MKKTLVIGLIFCLVLSSVSAWPFSSKDTSAGVVPLAQTLLPSSSNTETKSSTEEKTESTTPSTSSPIISNPEMVSIPKAELEAIVNELNSGVEDMEDGHEAVLAGAVDYEKKYLNLMKPRYIIKAVGEWNQMSIKAGIGFGVLFSQKYYVEANVMKNDLSAWSMDALTSLNGYTFSFGLGYTF